MQVDVLYLKIGGKGAQALHRLAEMAIKALEEAGLIGAEEIARQRLLTEEGQSNIKLHATLVNSKYRKGQGGNEGKGGKEGKGGATGKGGKGESAPRIPFDAKGVLTAFRNTNFGTETAGVVAISSITGNGPKGGYKHLATRSIDGDGR